MESDWAGRACHAAETVMNVAIHIIIIWGNEKLLMVWSGGDQLCVLAGLDCGWVLAYQRGSS